MKKTTLAFCILTALSSTARAANAPELVGNIEAGKAHAVTFNCIACHGADGNGITPLWPNLAGQHPSYIVQQIKAFESGSRKDPNMLPMVEPLKGKDQEVADLAAYYASQTKKIGASLPELAPQGQKIYRGGNKETGLPACMACHGPKGEGNAAAKYPAVSGQQMEYTKKQLMDYKSGARGNEGSGLIMRDVAAKMSVEEIAAVASHMAGLH